MFQAKQTPAVVSKRGVDYGDQKGGVGKRTTVLNLGAALSRLGRRVLMTDLDPQAHLTISSGIDLEGLKFSIYDALI